MLYRGSEEGSESQCLQLVEEGAEKEVGSREPRTLVHFGRRYSAGGGRLTALRWRLGLSFNLLYLTKEALSSKFIA